MAMTNTTTTPRLILHRAAERGHADHGWLDTWHSFSFADWYDPQRVHFGALRVLNDDTVAPGMGFGTHPHDNMEIISLVTEGSLKHKDSMGHEGVIQAGDVQVMSAGTGVLHSEFNPDAGHRSKFFQIWVFPRKRNATPRYQQVSLDPRDRENRFQQIVSPDPHDAGTWIGQDAWLHLGRFDVGRRASHPIKMKGHGVYAMVVSGSALIAGQELQERDAIGVEGSGQLEVTAGKEGAEVLLIEVPMELNN